MSHAFAVSQGCVTVGAPRSKRLALAALSLRVARLAGVTPKLASKLSGNWSSILLYRRCLSCVVDGLFALGALSEESEEKVIPLPRKIARELVVLACLSPVICTNVAVDYLGRVFASDASLQKGALCQGCCAGFAGRRPVVGFWCVLSP